MKRTIHQLLLLLFLFCSVQGFSQTPAPDTDVADDALKPATIHQPIPEAYSDSNRQFQGIPSMTITPGGRIWANWYTGGTTEGDDNYVLLVTSGDGGETWTKPLLAVDFPGPVRTYDPSMWTDSQGGVWLFWAQSFHWWDGRSGVWYIKTENPEDANTNWSAPQRICDGIMMCKPITDSKGRWLLPVSLWTLKPESTKRVLPLGANVIASSDQGATWNYLGHTLVQKDPLFDEHCLAERTDGSFLMMLRTKSGISESVSTDGGTTWSEPLPSEVKHTSSRFFLRRLKSGRLLLVKNGPINADVGRKEMTAFLSEDDGHTWKGGLLLDERTGVSYPDGDQLSDGTICVIYDWNRTSDRNILMARFTEEDILAKKIVSSQGKLKLLVNQATGVFPTPETNR